MSLIVGFPVTIPKGNSITGKPYLLVVADYYRNLEKESNEENNVGVASTQIQADPNRASSSSGSGSGSSSATKSGPDSGTGTDSGADSGAGTDSGTDSGAGSGTRTDSGAGTDSGACSGSATDSGAGTDSGTGTDSGSDAGEDNGSVTVIRFVSPNNGNRTITWEVLFYRIQPTSNPVVHRKYPYTIDVKFRSKSLYGRSFATHIDPDTLEIVSPPPCEPAGLLDTIDEFVSGLASALTGGLTDKLRELIYGRLATCNHEGTWARRLGELTGTGLSFTPAGGGGWTKSVRGALDAAETVSELIEVSKSALKLANGEGDLDDLAVMQ